MLAHLWNTQDVRVQQMFFRTYTPRTEKELYRMVRIVQDYETIKEYRAQPTEEFIGHRKAMIHLGEALAEINKYSDRLEMLDLMYNIIQVMLSRQANNVILLKKD